MQRHKWGSWQTSLLHTLEELAGGVATPSGCYICFHFLFIIFLIHLYIYIGLVNTCQGLIGDTLFHVQDTFQLGPFFTFQAYKNLFSLYIEFQPIELIKYQWHGFPLYIQTVNSAFKLLNENNVYMFIRYLKCAPTQHYQARTVQSHTALWGAFISGNGCIHKWQWLSAPSYGMSAVRGDNWNPSLISEGQYEALHVLAYI